MCSYIEDKDNIIVEIGTRHGGSLYIMSKFLSNGTIISIDMPGLMWGRSNSGTMKRKICGTIKNDGHDVHMIEADSHDLSTINNLKKILGNNNIDFLFIDGDHTYEGCKMDWKMYGPLSSKVAFHDIFGQPGVRKLWNEIKKTKKHIEITNSRKFGIGILWQ